MAQQEMDIMTAPSSERRYWLTDAPSARDAILRFWLVDDADFPIELDAMSILR